MLDSTRYAMHASLRREIYRPFSPSWELHRQKNPTKMSSLTRFIHRKSLTRGVEKVTFSLFLAVQYCGAP